MMKFFGRGKGIKPTDKMFYKYDDFLFMIGLFMSLLVVMLINHLFLLEIL
jgi:hypothetical protein